MALTKASFKKPKDTYLHDGEIKEYYECPCGKTLKLATLVNLPVPDKCPFCGKKLDGKD